ncbi:MAG: biopolymer transporter ExbD [Planctomycetota bacterium]
MLTSPKHRRRPLTIAMTPMIDVVFLLLIYFVCTASFTPPETVLAAAIVAEKTEQGAGTENNAPPLERIVVKVNSNGPASTWVVNSRTISSPAELTEVLEALAAIDARLPLVLDVTPATPVGVAVDAYDRCLRAGFQTLQFAVPQQP